MERLFRLDEIEATTKRRVVTLRRDIREGRLKAVRINRQVRVPESALIEFLTRSAQPHTQRLKGAE